MAPMLHRLGAALILLPLDNPAAWTIFNELPNAPSRKAWQMPELPSSIIPSWPTASLSSEANELTDSHRAVTRHLNSDCRVRIRADAGGCQPYILFPPKHLSVRIIESESSEKEFLTLAGTPTLTMTMIVTGSTTPTTPPSIY